MDPLPYTPARAPQVEALLDRCFGPARGRRTASLLRAGAECRADLSFVAEAAGELVGSVQLWPVALASPTGTHRLLLLGPLVSAPHRRGEAIGIRLMDRARLLLRGGDALPLFGRLQSAAAHAIPVAA